MLFTKYYKQTNEMYEIDSKYLGLYTIGRNRIIYSCINSSLFSSLTVIGGIIYHTFFKRLLKEDVNTQKLTMFSSKKLTFLK